MYIYSYRFGSESAKLLGQALGARRIKHRNSTFRGGRHQKVINWGCSTLPERLNACQVVNHPDAVGRAANKLAFFRHLDGWDGIPEWTNDINRAREWIADGGKACCRTLLEAREANGLVIAEEQMQLVTASLYTKYIPKRDEYRVHVMNGEVIAKQRKARRLDVPDDQVNWQVRTHDNGFVFQRTNVVVPFDVEAKAIECVRRLGLDFGGCDVVWNEQQQRAYVLEVNTAPGIEGTTVQEYARKFREHYA